jgi:pimeloyl-ACP methyl ester carboxylesterase
LLKVVLSFCRSRIAISETQASNPVHSLYLDAGGQSVFARFHPAAGGTTAGAVLICPPWGPDEIASYRPRRAWAERLAAAGHPVLRFDLPGTGNSTGGPRDPLVVESWLDSVAATASWLRRRTGSEVTVLGLGLGGLLATEAAARGAEIENLVLWGTPKTGLGFLREMQAFSRLQGWKTAACGEERERSIALAAGGFEVDGLLISAETGAELKDLCKDVPGPTVGHVLLISRETDQSPPPLAGWLAQSGAKVDFDDRGLWGRFVAVPTKARLPEEIVDRVEDWLAERPSEPSKAADARAPEEGPSVEFELDGSPVIEEPIAIAAPGTELFGVLVKPADGIDSDLCAVFPSAGALRTIGPNRMWVDRARALAVRGIPSLRLDFGRIGEAADDPDGIPPGDDYFLPEFQPQLEAALDQLDELGLGRRFLIVGNCSGAYHGLRTAIVDDRVSAVVMLNPSVIIWRTGFFEEQAMRAKVDRLGEGRWVRKLRDREVGLKQIAGHARTTIPAVLQDLRRRTSGRVGQAEDWERQLIDELTALRERGTDVTIAFSAEEPTRIELERSGLRAELERLGIVDFETMPGNDHTLRSLAAQQALAELLDAKLEELGGEPAVAGRRRSLQLDS